VGEDITFDESLIGAYGVTVHAFDPTPSVIDWVSGAVLPKSFAFHPYGVADFDGTAEFFPPQNQSYVSHSMVQNTGRDGIRVPVRRMATIMRELGHQKIDVLKMDIEGAEYAVIDDIVREGISIGQFLVEFHDRFASVGIGSTRAAIEKLEGIGFVPIANGESGDEFTFIHSSQLQRLRTL
jgi:FkbM family methyltransferase